MKSNMYDHPEHYNQGKIEVIDFIEDQKLGFNLGNAIKYIARAEHKENAVDNIAKAMWYLTREQQKRLGILTTTTEKNYSKNKGQNEHNRAEC